MRDPSKLRVLTAAEALAVATYKVTARFPRDERYGLTAQLRRAAVSVGSNIVEGSHRQGDAALAPFLHNSVSSAAEVQFQLKLANRLGFGAPDEVEALVEQTDHLRRMLIRLITSFRNRGD